MRFSGDSPTRVRRVRAGPAWRDRGLTQADGRSPEPLATSSGPAVGPKEQAEPAASIGVLVFTLLATSSVVFREPAPCDMLFPVVFGLALLTRHTVPLDRLPGLLYLSMGALLVANYASLIYAWNLHYSGWFMGVTLYMLAYFVFFSSFVGRWGARAVDLIRGGYLTAATFAAVVAILTHLRLIPNYQMFYRDASLQRVKSTFKDPNVFGPFLVGGILLCLAYLVYSKKVKFRYFVVLGLSLIGLLLTFSRGAYLHLFVSVIVFFTLELLVIGNRRATRRILTGALWLAPVGIVGSLVVLVVSDMGGYFIERLSLQAYDQERFGNQALALRASMQNLIGIGPGQWRLPMYDLGMHNLYLRVLAENGVAGFLALLTFLGSCLYQGLAGVFRRGPLSGLCAASLAVSVGIMAESMVIDTLHWRHFFLFLSIPVGLGVYEHSHRTERSVAQSDGSALMPIGRLSPARHLLSKRWRSSSVDGSG